LPSSAGPRSPGWTPFSIRLPWLAGAWRTLSVCGRVGGHAPAGLAARAGALNIPVRRYDRPPHRQMTASAMSRSGRYGAERPAACHLSLAGHRRLPTPGRPARASPCPSSAAKPRSRDFEARVIALRARGDHGR
jgi:hypothetical protein